MRDVETHRGCASADELPLVSVGHDAEGNVVVTIPRQIDGAFRMRPDVAVEFADQLVLFAELAKQGNPAPGEAKGQA